MADKYTVWVGGVEINDNLMPKEEAETFANLYRLRGYEDVHVERYCSIPQHLESYHTKQYCKK